MFKSYSPLAVACALLLMSCLAAVPAQAFQLVTFVSGKGTDSGNCASPASPCRSFQFAINQTSPFGEVKALDPAHYGGMVITKSVSITGVDGASINRTSGDAIVINAGPNDVVKFSHLDLDGIKAANNGIVFNSGGSLTITHCTVQNFKVDGIRIVPAASTTKLLISHTLVSDNTSIGLDVLPGATGKIQGTIDHVTAINNKYGINVDSRGSKLPSFVTIVDSNASDNSTDGVAVGEAVVYFRDTIAMRNNNAGFDMVGFPFVVFARSASLGSNCDISSPGGSAPNSAGNNLFLNFCGPPMNPLSLK